MRVVCWRVAGWAVVGLTFAVPSARAAAPQLPSPSGPYGIGRIAYDWKDASRVNSCLNVSKAQRELMVYIWYPSLPMRADARGAYIPHAREMDANREVHDSMSEGYGANWPLIVSGAASSHAVDDAPVAASRTKFPLILFSHGMGSSPFAYSELIEDLVSRGFVVAAIEHTCDADAVVFPGGRIVSQQDPPLPAGASRLRGLQRMMAVVNVGISEGAGDLQFVLDLLTEMNGGSAQMFPLAGKLDLSEVAAMGHSAGGSFVARACQMDRRFRACVDLEGQLIPVEALPDFNDGARLTQPLLYMEIARRDAEMGGTPEDHQAYYRKRTEQLKQCAPGSYFVSLRAPGMQHGSFSDPAFFNGGTDRVMGEQRLHLIEEIVRAFLNQTLRQRPEPLLRGVGIPASDAVIKRIGVDVP
jgi:hypothetical protein